MKKNEKSKKKTENAVGDNMRNSEKKIEEKVKKKFSLNGSKTLQNKETKVIESVEWIEPCLNLQLRVSPDEK